MGLQAKRGLYKQSSRRWREYRLTTAYVCMYALHCVCVLLEASRFSRREERGRNSLRDGDNEGLVRIRRGMACMCENPTWWGCAVMFVDVDQYGHKLRGCGGGGGRDGYRGMYKAPEE